MLKWGELIGRQSASENTQLCKIPVALILLWKLWKNNFSKPELVEIVLKNW